MADDWTGFDDCRASMLSQSKNQWSYVAGRKYCVDQAIKRISDRVARTQGGKKP